MSPLLLIWGLAGWVITGYLANRVRRQRKAMVELTELMSQAGKHMSEAYEALNSVYRVRLSCPACDWTSTVIRDNHDEAIAEGNRRITVHNEEQGHVLTGEPRSGYWRGEPLN